MPMENNKRIAVLSIYPFPNGFAATNRILAYSKGLVENGAQVDVFVPFPTDRRTEAQNLPNFGSHQGVSYYYTSGRYRSKLKIFRAISILSGFRKYYGYYTSCRCIAKRNSTNEYCCIIISTDTISSLFVYSLLAKKLGIRSIFIFDEFPVPIRHKLKKQIPWWKKYLYSKVLKQIDAYVSISEELKRFYNNLCIKPTHVLPVIVDVSRFTSESVKISDLSSSKYLCYMGNMELSKDDVDNIIKAFSLICSDYPDIKLFLYGSPKRNTMEYLNSLITSLGVREKVVLKGKVERDEVPQIMRQAYILVSSQPDTLRAAVGFPTKLGEYLATGVPALLTDVGENAKYVRDGEHIFFSKPGDQHAYAERLNYIIENYAAAKLVASNGRKFLLTNYSQTIKGKELLEFLSSL